MDKGFYEYASYGSVGIAWVLSTVIYAYIGYTGGRWLDQRFAAEPLFMVLGLLVAVGLSLYSLITNVLGILAEMDRRQGKRKP